MKKTTEVEVLDASGISELTNGIIEDEADENETPRSGRVLDGEFGKR